MATAAIREAANRDDLVAAVRTRCGVDVEVLTDGEEARLAFVGATRALTEPVTDTVVVVDVGGGSSELAVGTIDGGVTWSASLRLGSGTLADAYLRSDPPAARELNAVRQHVGGAFEGLAIPPAELAVAVGGSATSLRRLVGACSSPRRSSAGCACSRARRSPTWPAPTSSTPSGSSSCPPASSCSRRRRPLGLPLQIARGGLREGVILEMMDSRAAPEA